MLQIQVPLLERPVRVGVNVVSVLAVLSSALGRLAGATGCYVRPLSPYQRVKGEPRPGEPPHALSIRATLGRGYPDFNPRRLVGALGPVLPYLVDKLRRTPALHVLEFWAVQREGRDVQGFLEHSADWIYSRERKAAACHLRLQPQAGAAASNASVP